MIDTKITAYKGFSKDMKCRDYQYEIGETYKHEGIVSPCNSGFHACENPLDVFSYYPPAESVFAIVEQSGEIKSESDKICSAVITIKAEISLHMMIDSAVKVIFAGLKKQKTKGATKRAGKSLASNTGDQSAASNTGDQSAASNTGYYSAASNTGDQSAASNTGYRSAASNTGDRSAASNTGDRSAASNTGDRSAASNTGDQSAASNTGYRSAASNTGDRSAASNTGYYSAASNTGDRSAASNTGDQSAASVEGENSVAIVTGYQSKAKASKGSWIVVTERNDDYEIICVKTAKAGTSRIKADTYYTLEKSKFVEVKS